MKDNLIRGPFLVPTTCYGLECTKDCDQCKYKPKKKGDRCNYSFIALHACFIIAACCGEYNVKKALEQWEKGELLLDQKPENKYCEEKGKIIYWYWSVDYKCWTSYDVD